MVELTTEELKQHFSDDIFKRISETADELGLECYVVGGYVRDIFLQRPSKDIDVVVVGSGIEMAEALGKCLGRGAHVAVFKNFGTAQVKYRGKEVEFVGARKESYQRDSRKPIVEDGTLEDDQNRRDFTINALAVCLNQSRFGELVDPFGGIEDLKEKTIRTPLDPDITFSDDPLRMMRCIRFATQLNFYIDDATFESLCRNCERISIIVKVIEWPDKAKNPIGQVIDILGKAGDNTTEMHAILAEFGLPYVYPSSVEKAADKIPAEISDEEIAKREDFRNVTTFTIDPKDAKDFDDALSIRKLKDGLWEVGVHIADVTHYVTEGSIIDKEAEKRATSVYLVDRTIPMLPERLCNFICSLRPDEEKLAYSVIFNINEKGDVKDSRVVHTVIKSDRRFTYEEAQQIIETKEGDFKEEILMLDTIAKALRQKRFVAGAINFDRYEVKFEIDEKGKPISVYFKVSKDANKLVEEFMLLANRTVAEKIGRVPKSKKAKVFPYRIHDLPDPEKLDNLAQFIARFGYKIRTGGTKTDVSKSINHLLDDIQGKKEENLIETVSIRAMQKARYSTHNIGHYGLAFEYYTHFTSPIRRFPDMMVHRLLTKYLNGGRSVSETKYEDLCDHSSNMEQIAANAERASIKYKQVEFMTERLGQVFDGVISGVTEWGLYVELNENKCEGMIPIRDLGDDYYEFDEKNYCLRGRRKHRTYSLGDAITIKVARANLEKKQLDFALVE